MTTDEQVRAKMAETFRVRPWAGFLPKEEVLAQLLCYRDSLPDEEKALYDEQILSGRHPSTAAETLELMRDAGLLSPEKSLVLNKAS